jgi:type IV pilus assembly protein PilQ
MMKHALLFAFTILFLLSFSQGVFCFEELPYRGNKIDLVVVEADIRDVLLLFGECTGMNMVISGDIQGKITLRLHDVPWDQAFDIIIGMARLEAVVSGNTVILTKQ